MRGLYLRASGLDRERWRGFTIVELLIVVVVIAILAAITVVAYNGITVQAKESALKSELTTAAKKLQLAKVESGAFPTAAPADTASAKFQYTRATNTFCLTVTNPGLPEKAFHITENGIVNIGACLGHTVDGSEWIGNNGIVTTIAGGTQGYADGTGTAARFNRPSGMVLDSTGTFYIADSGNNRIRKMTPAGQVTTIAGTGERGFADGPGETAKFAGPADLAVDTAGNIYVADTGNNRIRKITPTGQVTTLAGYATITEICEDDGEGGEYCYEDTGGAYADGSGGAARFSSPVGIAVDSNGNVFVADNWNSLLRKITPAGEVTTFAGSTTGGAWQVNGTGSSANFRSIGSLTIGEGNTIYVTDSNTIRKVSPGAVVTTIAGSNYGWVDGAANVAKFHEPAGIAIAPSGNIFVADSHNMRIRRISPAGEVTTFAGSGSVGSGGGGFADGIGTAAMFRRPLDIISDSSGVLYVLDSNNNRIRKIE